MIAARSLRKKGRTLDQIAAALGVTRQGARYLLGASDKFATLKLGSYKDFKKYMKESDEGDTSLQSS